MIAKKDLNNDGIGFVELYDFSKANTSEEARINAVTTVASICYGNKNAIGSIKLYNRLAMENKGLPSSSYEFVPILLNTKQLEGIMQYRRVPSVIKYGEFVNEDYLLTNLRALIADVGADADMYYNIDEEEINIIASNFKVFRNKIDMNTARQFMRHRASWQELSRRFVSGNREPFEFYISDRIKSDNVTELFRSSVELYDKLIQQGIKPEEARRVLPQAMYTTVWSAWLPSQLEVLLTLRIDKHSQREIREMAMRMRELCKDVQH